MNDSDSLLVYPTTGPSVTAFSTTRHGGCGSDTYGTFNCTPYTGDELAVVRANQERLCRLLDISADNLIIPYQTHSCNILAVDQAFMQLSGDARHALMQERDAVMTDRKGVCLCVSTADCIPVLLHDTARGAIAAVHAGWRGTVNRIVELTLQAMHDTYGTQPADIRAVIGPGISLDAFEVGMEVYEAFASAGFDMSQLARRHEDKGKYYIDLPHANRLQLLEAGVLDANIHDSAICTYTCHRDFFSARRLGIRSGRILNGIIMN